jgi:hypothetical protein
MQDAMDASLALLPRCAAVHCTMYDDKRAMYCNQINRNTRWCNGATLRYRTLHLMALSCCSTLAVSPATMWFSASAGPADKI